MADLSDTDRRRIEEAVASALADADAGRPKSAAAAPAIPDRALADPINFFCEYWPKAKGILQFLLPFLPPPLKTAVQTLIIIGDKVHSVICG